VALKGDAEARVLEDTLTRAEKRAKHPWGIRRIGEIGIGINPRASLAGTTLINEKVLGTAHVALGSNVWFGGSIFAISHYDQVFRNPTLYIDGNRIDIRNI
jgi:leucyl aminopeptidase (aminopeptidase T)